MKPFQLAAYAAKDEESLGRVHKEDFKDARADFERDRDRIIHCGAFRRLEYKTQVFINHEGDYYRTRLTHSIEVAQISRGVAGRLDLNPDLAEALALAHDLGHTPFGHAGEETLNELMKDEGGFEHNDQSLRVVTVLEERYPQFPGLNLSFETLEGIVKHSSYFDHPHPDHFAPYHPEWKPTLEAQLINNTDAVAYVNHDIDDGLESGLLDWEKLKGIEIWNRMLKDVKKRYGDVGRHYQKTMAISHLIGYFIGDLAQNTLRNIRDHGVKNLRDVREAPVLLVSHSEEAARLQKEMSAHLSENLYKHFKIERRRFQAQHAILMLFKAYEDRPEMMPDRYRRLGVEFGPKRAICDYIAGMTDRYAMQEYALFYETPLGPR